MRTLRILAVLTVASIFTAPREASAQKSWGIFLGQEFDLEDNWLLFGAELRLPMTNRSTIINPRLSFHPFEGGSVIQADVNALWPVQFAGNTSINPYLGLGAAIVRDKFGDFSDTNVGYNIVTGLRFNLAGSTLRPYLHSQYTVVVDYPNAFTLGLGLLFNIGGNP